MSIEIHQLSKDFQSETGQKTVLAGVELSVKPGEIFALMGANGSGKTTLLKIIATLILPSSGSVSVSGIDTLARPADARRRLGLVYDSERSFYQVLSVKDNLWFYAQLFGMAKKDFRSRLDSLAERLDLFSWLNVKLNHCSSGIKQRLAVCRALLPDPEVILIDELTRSLDAVSQQRITEYLQHAAHSEGKTCLLVTHDAGWAKQYADRMGTLERGAVR